MTQIIPCNVEMYAVFREEDGGETGRRVLAFGLHHDCCGDVVPLIFDPVLGISETNIMHFERYEIGPSWRRKKFIHADTDTD